MLIRCEGGGQASRKVRITVYGAGGLLGGFHADKDALNAAARRVYAQLEQLSTWADDAWDERERRFRTPLGDEGFELLCADLFHPSSRASAQANPECPLWAPWVEQKLAERTQLLDGLKDAGVSLHAALFRDPAAHAPLSRLEAAMRKAYQNELSDRRIVIQPHPELHLPWGLLFDPTHDQGENSSADETARYGGFWALRYDVSVTSQPARPWRPEGQDVDFGVLSLVEEAMEELVRSDLGQAGHDELFDQPPIGKAHSLRECTQHLNSNGVHRIDVLLHFLGHQHDQQLVVGNERIDYDKFQGLLGSMALPGDLRRDGSYGLVFINGCRTALGKDGCSLQSAVDELPDLCGAIATEGAVRRPFAAEFARRFIRLLREGDTISTAMKALRRAPDLWPESLLYGCYASPDFCIARPATAGASRSALN